MEDLDVASSCSGMELEITAIINFRDKKVPTFPPAGLFRRALLIIQPLSSFPCRTPVVMTKQKPGDNSHCALPGWLCLELSLSPGS